jgi:hypothetical protein
MSAVDMGPRKKRPFRSEDLDVTRGAAEPPVIEHVEIAYERWPGKILDPKRDWMGKCGKGGGCVKPLDGGEPEPSCNEIEVVKLLRARLGYEAHFFTNWGSIPEKWQEWVRPLREMPDWLKDFDDALRKMNGGPTPGARRAGLPDVVGWDPKAPDTLSSAVFVECKKPGERVGKNQERWFATAIALGVPPESFAVAVRISR